jgi:carotenoid cleavage dioxygenase-like enzyme
LRAGKLLHKGAFQVGDPSGKWQSPLDISVRKPANTGVINWAGKILALFEQDIPHELDASLHTKVCALHLLHSCNRVQMRNWHSLPQCRWW